MRLGLAGWFSTLAAMGIGSAALLACSDDGSSASLSGDDGGAGSPGDGGAGGEGGAGDGGGDGGTAGDGGETGDGGSAGSGGSGGTGGAAEDGGAIEMDAGDDAASMQPVTLSFRAVVRSPGDAGTTVDATCGETYMLGSPATEVDLLDLRFYVSNLRLIDDQDEEVPLQLDQDTPFQHQNVALLDFEDATGACAASGTEQTRSEITGEVPEGAYTGVAFELGVPFELNHEDVALADPPLNIQNLFWNWLPGYKFVRIDVKPTAGADGGAAMPWNFHLGSTMCMQDVADGGSPNPQAPPSGPCGRPNRPSYVLDDFEAGSDTIVLDLGALFAGSDLTTNLGGSTPGCMSFPPDEPDCASIFPNLGMSYTSGACEGDCTGQTVFSIE